jgi:hypothetical protein
MIQKMSERESRPEIADTIFSRRTPKVKSLYANVGAVFYHDLARNGSATTSRLQIASTGRSGGWGVDVFHIDFMKCRHGRRHHAGKI